MKRRYDKTNNRWQRLLMVVAVLGMNDHPFWLKGQAKSQRCRFCDGFGIDEVRNPTMQSSRRVRRVRNTQYHRPYHIGSDLRFRRATADSPISICNFHGDARRSHVKLQVSNSGGDGSKITGKSRAASTSKSKSKSKKPSNGNKNNSNQQMRKSDVDEMLRGMGITPVGKARRDGDALQQRQKSEEKSRVNDANTSVRYSSVPTDVQLQYCRNGHAALRNILHPKTLKAIQTDLEALARRDELKAWQQKVEVASDSSTLASSCRTVQQCQRELLRLGITESVPFLQYFNTWRTHRHVQQLAKDLAPVAGALMDVPCVRLYQDSVFWKRAGDGPTPWHIDARMAPFDTPHMITIWIPFQPVPAVEGTALVFCSKSHNDMALPYWNPITQQRDGDNANDANDADNDVGSIVSEWDRLEQRYPQDLVDYMPMSVGDVTVHSGWTLHCSNDNVIDKDRMALAISYVDAAAEIRPECAAASSSPPPSVAKDASQHRKAGIGDSEDAWSYADWVKDVPPRQPFDHPLVPIVWTSS